MAKTLKDRVIEEQGWLHEQIQDALKDMQKCAQQLERRAQEAIACTGAAIEGRPTSTSWIVFLEGDTRRIREAKGRLEQLIDKKRLVDHLAAHEQE